MEHGQIVKLPFQLFVSYKSLNWILETYITAHVPPPITSVGLLSFPAKMAKLTILIFAIFASVLVVSTMAEPITSQEISAMAERAKAAIAKIPADVQQELLQLIKDFYARVAASEHKITKEDINAALNYLKELLPALRDMNKPAQS